MTNTVLPAAALAPEEARTRFGDPDRPDAAPGGGSSRPRNPSRVPGWPVVGVVAAVIAVAGGIGVGGSGATSLSRTADDVGLALLAAGAAAASGLNARRSRSGWRTAWALLCAGLTSWTIGQLYWTYEELARARVPSSSSLADVGYVGFSVCSVLAAWFFGSAERRSGRLRSFLDGLMVASALLLIAWTAVLDDLGEMLHTRHEALWVSLTYPISDVMLLSAAVQLLVAPRARRSWAALLCLAMGSLAVADSCFGYLTATWRYHTGDPIDLGWMLGFGLLALSARAAGGSSGADEEVGAADRPDPLGPWAARMPGTPLGSGRRLPQMVMLPYAVIAAAAACVVVATSVEGRPIDSAEGVMLVVTAGLVLARQSLAVHDHQRLVRIVATREAQLRFQAYHDHLTGLPNRAQFNQKVEEALARHHRDGLPVAVVFCDLDDFKLVNDTLGHRAGDELLVDVAARLRSVTRPGDTLARLGGDEFAVLVTGEDAPARVGRRLIDALAEPFPLDGRSMNVRASVGVAVADGTGSASAVSLLANADLAMYSVKQNGKGGASLYRPGLQVAAMEDFDLRSGLMEALRSGGLSVEYQPVVQPRTGLVLGFEALARWRRASGPVRPDVFVPLAERMGVVSELTDWVLDAALGQLARWSAELGDDTLQVGVNVSAQELYGSRLPERIGAILERHALRSEQVVLEVTESAVMHDADRVAAVGAEIRALGVHLAIDDFGAGQSSMARLHALPFDILKVDRSLVKGIDVSDQRARIVAAVLGLGVELGMDVVVEGVETDAELTRLRATGRPFLMQGYLTSPPVPARHAASLLDTPLLLDPAVVAEPGAGTLAG